MDEGQGQEVWAPPEGFVPLPSRVAGIELYAPAPKGGPPEQTRSFKCPFCGGITAYSAEQRQLTCAHCGRAQELTAEVVGRAAEQFEFTLEAMEHARYGWGEQRRELACESCGAVVAVAPDVLTSTCAFCGSHRVLARDAVGDALRPTALIPFGVDAERCQAQLRDWLGRGWMHPPELRSVRALHEMIGIYLPFWTFDTHVHARWRAEVGTERTEFYFEGGERKTRTVIDWQWRSGGVAIPVRDHLVPGTARVSRRLLEKIGPFDLGALVEYAPAFLAGWQAKTCDVSLPQAWETAKEEIRERARRACRADTGSVHVRNFQMTADFADERWRYVLLPAYLVSYRFAERIFQVIVNGQTGKVAGQKPVSWLRVWLAIAALLAPGLLISLLGLLLSVFGFGVVLIGAGFVVLIAGLGGAGVVFFQARAAEQV